MGLRSGSGTLWAWRRSPAARVNAKPGRTPCHCLFAPCADKCVRTDTCQGTHTRTSGCIPSSRNQMSFRRWQPFGPKTRTDLTSQQCSSHSHTPPACPTHTPSQHQPHTALGTHP